MASPAAPAGGQDTSAASFLGALISLTSHSNIRYQGILSNIDAAHATLSLEKDEVAKSDNVYDYIVFRAADVVDLRIDDPSPKKDAAAPQQGYPYGGFAPPYMGHPMYPPHGANFGAPPPHMQGIRPPFVPPAAPESVTAAPKHLDNKGTAPLVAEKSKDVGGIERSLASMQVNDAKPGHDQPVKKDKSSEVPSTKSIPSSDLVQPKPEGKPASQTPPGRPTAQAPAKKTETWEKPVEPVNTGAKTNAPASSAEFDFEKANARFSKNPTAFGKFDLDAGKLDAIPPADTQSFYNKKSGFFDNISSEVKDRHEGGRTRNTMAEEKERNMLTFGDEAANFSGPPRRSRGRGQRSRGRGGGGRGRGPAKPEWV
ncbi:hypothetical protein MEQU1_002032 [Malassezia equina]|uniref:FFD box profile domain-containing protein n=1 Tax=Malassezia equina TaxID=1381935 RepID=A0AAF0EFB0_9BASI|nr:hypothetical protein MEQU1_002032 [Malassezia equina]